MLATYDFFGAYFPAWLPAMVCGLAATVVLRTALIASKVHARLPLPLVVYLASVVLFTCLAWFIVR